MCGAIKISNITTRFISPDIPWSFNRPYLARVEWLKSTVIPVLEPLTIIVGAPDLFVNKGSTINLTCVVKYAPEPPPSMTWSHNGDVSITYRKKTKLFRRYTKKKNIFDTGDTIVKYNYVQETHFLQ